MPDDDRDEREGILSSDTNDTSITGPGFADEIGGQEDVTGEGRPVEKGEAAKRAKSGSLIPTDKPGQPPETWGGLFCAIINPKNLRDESYNVAVGKAQFEEAMLRAAASGMKDAMMLVFSGLCLTGRGLSALSDLISGSGKKDKSDKTLPEATPVDENAPPSLFNTTGETQENERDGIPPLVTGVPASRERAEGQHDMPVAAVIAEQHEPPSLFSAIAVPAVSGASVAPKGDVPPLFANASAATGKGGQGR